MDTKELNELFDRLRKGSLDQALVESLQRKYLSGSTPTYELSIVGVPVDLLFGLLPKMKDQPASIGVVTELAEGIVALLKERGYRTNTKTLQEDMLGASSSSGVSADPYLVGGVHKGLITVEEASKARSLESFVSVPANYWRIKGFERMLLQPIDNNGRTIRDPVLIDASGKVIAEKLVEGAPYRR